MKKYILILLSLLSCKKIDDNGFRIYTIKCGDHKSRSALKTPKTNNLQLKAEKNIKNQEYIYSKLLYYNHINNIEKQKIKNSMITNISEF